jgi:hypothetical protein
VARSCEHGYKRSGSINGGEYLDQLSYYQLIKEFVKWNYSKNIIEGNIV